MALALLQGALFAETVTVFYDKALPSVTFAVGDIKQAATKKGLTVDEKGLSELNGSIAGKKIVIALSSDAAVTTLLAAQGGSTPGTLGSQAYAMRTTSTPDKSYWVIGGDTTGAMYGGLQIAEYLNFRGFNGIYTEDETPRIKERGVKINIPYDYRSPTYFNNTNGSAHRAAIEQVWDMKFWTTWFDEMARHRYNALSMWSCHPYTSMIKMPDYPLVALDGVRGYDANGKEYQVNTMTIDQKVAFWKQVMKYGYERGFNIYLITWNVFLYGAEGKYGLTRDQSNAATQTYLRKCNKQILETYPYLTGIGVTAGEAMDGTDDDKEKWLWNSYGAGMLDFAKENPNRKMAFIHRFWLTDITKIKSYFTPLKQQPNVRLDLDFKYSMAHMHSALTPGIWQNSDMEGNCGILGSKSWLTIRNDDFYYLHWADPTYVKDYILNFPDLNKYVERFFIGSDGWVFTNNFTSKDAFYKNVKPYAIQKTWLMQKLWGRISYNPNVPTELFRDHIAYNLQLSSQDADNLLSAWSSASRALQLANEQVTGTWNIDKNFWPEAWTALDRTTPKFLTLADAKDAVPFRLASVNSFRGTDKDDKPTRRPATTQVDLIENNALANLARLPAISAEPGTELGLLKDNLLAMGYLGLYNNYKYRAVLASIKGNTTDTRNFMGKAYACWKKYTDNMDAHYTGAAMQRNADLANWHANDAQVLKEFVSLGGYDNLITFDAPKAAALYTAPATVPVQVKTSSSAVASVELWSNGVKIDTDTSAPFAFTLTNLAKGSYHLEIRAIDAKGVPTYGYQTIAVKDGSTSTAAPSIEMQPSNQSVVVGSPASFTVAVSGSPAPTLQWFRGQQPISGATSATYVLSATSLTDTGAVFRVVATNSQGTATSNDAVLTVTALTNTPPTITALADVTTKEDTPTGVVTFTVADSQTAVGSLTVTATSSNAALIPNTASGINLGGSGANRTLMLTPTANQSGSSTITVTVSDGSLTASRSFTLTVTAVNDPPTVAKPIDDQIFNVGTAVSYTVPSATFADLDSTNLTWTASGLPNGLTFKASTRTISGTVDAAGVANVTVSVSDGGASASDSFTITFNEVSSGSPAITTQPSDQRVSAGQTATFTVVAKGDPTLTYQWRKDGEAIAGATSASYTTPVLAIADFESTYTCLVANGLGSVESAAARVVLTWQSADIGAVAAAGSDNEAAGTWTIAGSGADIWTRSDEFRFVWQPVDGDVTITARVLSQTNTDSWAKAGVMIRQSQTADAAYAMTCVTPTRGVTMQRRLETAGASNYTAGPLLAAPYWVRLERLGSVIIGSCSSDGANWTEMRRETIAMDAGVLVGLAVTSHNDGTLTTAKFDQVTITAAPSAKN